MEDSVGGVAGGDCEAGSFGGEGKPAALEFYVAYDVDVVFAAGAHEAGADGGDANAFVAELGVEAFGESYEGELCGGVGKHVGDGHLAADGSDVDDGGAAGSGEGDLFTQVREGGPGGVEGGEEVDLHGALEDVEGLGFDGAYVDDAGVVDQDVDAAEAGDGFVDEALGFLGLGEVGGYEVEVFGLKVGVLGEEGFLGLLELSHVAGSEDEAGGWLGRGTGGEAGGDGEAEAAGASGNENDGAWGVGVGECGFAVADGADDEDGGSGGDDRGGDRGYGDSCGGGGGGGGEGS